MPLERVRDRLCAVPRTTLADLAEGTAGRVVGRTRPLDPRGVVEAPFSGRPCVYFDVRVEERTALIGGWQPVLMQQHGVPFLIQDGTARAVIDTTESSGSDLDREIDIAEETVYRNPSVRELQFLESHRFTYAAGRRFRYREAIIAFDELIAVLGAGVREGDPLAPPPSDYRSEPPTRLRFSSSRTNHLLISTASEAVLAP